MTQGLSRKLSSTQETETPRERLATVQLSALRWKEQEKEIDLLDMVSTGAIEERLTGKGS